MPAFIFKNTTTGGSNPGSLLDGELSLNIADRTVVRGTGATVTNLVHTVGAQQSSNVNISGGSMSLTNLNTSSASAVRASALSLGGSSITGFSDGTPDGGSNSKIVTQNAVDKAAFNNKGKLKNVYHYSSNGTYVKSGSDVKRLHVIVMGGGGGARSYGEGGGSGGYAEDLLDATGISTVTVTVGGGGAGGAYFGFSPGGGTSSFGSYVSASGGGGANSHIQHAGGLPGIGSNGIVNTYGGGGGGHNNLTQYSNNCAPPSEGGVGFFGGGVPGAHANRARGPEYAAPGAGGVPISASHNGQGGRNGAPGLVIVYEYK